mgnify:CR=1
MQVVKINALASFAERFNCCAISREIGAMITIVAAFERSSVKSEV